MSLMNKKVYFFPKKEMYRMNVGRIVGCGWNENRDKQGRIFKKKEKLVYVHHTYRSNSHQ